MKFVRKKEFTVAAPDLEDKIFIAYVAALIISNNVYLFYKAQIISLKVDKTSTNIPPEYSNFTDVFFLDLVANFPEHTVINNQPSIWLMASSHLMNRSIA